MNKIDTSNWGEFKIGDLFHISRPVSRSQTKYDEGEIPFVASGNFNNGVLKYVNPKDEDCLDQGNCISVSPIDGSAFYQEKDFLGRGGAGSSIILLYNENLNIFNGYFIATVIRCICKKYAYSDMANKDIISNEKIKLPINKDGEPDFAYMEQYMQNRAAAVSDSLMALQSAKSLTNSEISTSEWKEFKIGDLFDIHPTKAYKLTNSGLFEIDGVNPIIVNSSFNNGVGGYTNLETTESGGIITFSDTTSSDAIFYQKEPFVGYPHVQGMYPIGDYKDKWDDYALLYLLSVFKAQSKNLNYDYVNKFTRESAKLINIKLPVDKNGNPDFEYMANFMKIIENTTRNKLNNLKIAL